MLVDPLDASPVELVPLTTSRLVESRFASLSRVVFCGAARASIIPLLFLPFATALLIVLNVGDSGTWITKRRLEKRVWYNPAKTSSWPAASARLSRVRSAFEARGGADRSASGGAAAWRAALEAWLCSTVLRLVSFCDAALATGDIHHSLFDADQKDAADGAAEWRSISLVANTAYDTMGRAGFVPGSEWRRVKLRYCKSMLTNDLKDFKRLVRTTIGLGLKSEARDPDFRIVTSMNSHYALSANLLNSLDPKKCYMLIAAGPLNKPRHSSLMQFTSGYIQGMVLGSGEWRKIVYPTIALHAFCLITELVHIAAPRHTLLALPAFLGGAGGFGADAASLSPIWWLRHAVSLLFIGTVGALFISFVCLRICLFAHIFFFVCCCSFVTVA